MWIVFSHVAQRGGVDEKLFFLGPLDSMGRQRDAMRAPGAAAYLDDLSHPGPPPALLMR